MKCADDLVVVLEIKSATAAPGSAVKIKTMTMLRVDRNLCVAKPEF